MRSELARLCRPLHLHRPADWRPPSALRWIIALAMMSLLCGCGGAPAPDLGVRNGHLLECPESPNCVSSETSDATHRVEPFKLAAAGSGNWEAVQAALAGMPRAKITRASPGYLRVEFTSAVLGFVDDLELQRQPAEGRIAVRSASRVGYSDLGVNRRRVENIRELLKQRGAVQ
jgi:uncharacterized protein (DUF1499 family)